MFKSCHIYIYIFIYIYSRIATAYEALHRSARCAVGAGSAASALSRGGSCLRSVRRPPDWQRNIASQESHYIQSLSTPDRDKFKHHKSRAKYEPEVHGGSNATSTRGPNQAKS